MTTIDDVATEPAPVSSPRRRDAAAVRGARPFVCTNLKNGDGVAEVIAWIERELLFDR